MSKLETARRGPRTITSLPETLESAFRAAVCEAIFRKAGEPGIAAELSSRAIFHFDRIVHESLVFGSIEQARTDVSSWAARFAEAALCRRLAHLPPNRVHLAGDRELDLLAVGDDGRHYAIRFVAFRSRSEQLALARRVRAVSPDVAGLIIFSIDDGTLRRFRLTAREARDAPRAAHVRRLAAPI